MARQSANYPPELRERATRMVAEVKADYPFDPTVKHRQPVPAR